MKVILVCALLLCKTILASTSGVTAATLKFNQLSETLESEKHKRDACVKDLGVLKLDVAKKQSRTDELASQIKDIKAEISEEDHLLGVCQAKLGITQKMLEQNKEIAFELSHKNKDNEKVLQAKLAEVSQTIDELTAESQGLSAALTKAKDDRDKENEKGEELDAKVAALNIKMESVLKMLKQMQADAESEQRKRLEISAKQLAAMISKWDAQEAHALELEQELEKLDHLEDNLEGVLKELRKEFQDTKVVKDNIVDQITTLEIRRRLADDAGDESSLTTMDLPLEDGEPIVNLVNPDAKPKKHKKPKKPKKDDVKVVPTVEKTDHVYFTKDKDGNVIAIDVKKEALQVDENSYSYVELVSDPLENIRTKVSYFKEETGLAVQALKKCRTETVNENAMKEKLESTVASQVEELKCAQDEIVKVYNRKEKCDIELNELKNSNKLVDQNNKALAAENGAGAAKIQELVAALKESRESVHILQIKLTNQHHKMTGLNKEIESEREHEEVVSKMIVNIEATIASVQKKMQELETKVDCPTLKEEENEQKLVLVEGAYNEATERVVYAEKAIIKKKQTIEAQKSNARMLHNKIDNQRAEINRVSNADFQGLSESTPEESKVGSAADIVPFYKNQFVWLLMLFSFAAGYFGYNHIHRDSIAKRQYKQILVPTEIALEKI